MSIFDEADKWEKTEGKRLFSSIIDIENPTILDYGCGAGNYSLTQINPKRECFFALNLTQNQRAAFHRG